MDVLWRQILTLQPAADPTFSKTILFLMGRLVLTDWIMVFVRDWRPRGPLLVVTEGVFSATDPPLKAVRKVVPPLRLGSIALDLSFMVVLLAVWLAIAFLR